MAAEYNFPKDDEKTLYINADSGSFSFGDLFENIADHFGEGCTIDQFNIEHERIKITGCSCCHDSTDYTNYLMITKRDPGDECKDVRSMSLNYLIIE